MRFINFKSIKWKKNKPRFLLLIILILLVIPGLVGGLKNYYLNESKYNTPTPSPTLMPTNTPTLTPTSPPQPTIIPFTPTPTKPVYKYILWKTYDEIHIKLNPNVGFAIAAYLLDEKWNVVTNQAGFIYEWSMDDKSLVRDGAKAFSGCTRGIQEPCPDDHYSFVATQSGQTLIRVNVKKDNEVVAATTFPLIVEK